MVNWRAEHQGTERCGGVHQPVGQRPDPDAAGLQGGDDVDHVAQVTVEAVDPPDDQGVARAPSEMVKSKNLGGSGRSSARSTPCWAGVVAER
jgi:hypothetical protein